MEHSEVLILKSSPHLKSGPFTDQIMQQLFLALLPIALAAIVTQGVSMLLLLVVSTGAAVLTERAHHRISGTPLPAPDYNAASTGMLLGLTLPAGFPLWMAVVGAVVGVGAGKLLFGGLGSSLFNPPATGRAFLQACFPAAAAAGVSLTGMERFTRLEPGTFTIPLLSAPATAQVSDSGNFFVPLVIVLAGAWLIRKGMLKWRVSAAMLIAAVVLGALFHHSRPESYPGTAALLANTVFLLGALFLAPELTTSPTTRLGMWIYGALAGMLAAVLWRRLGLNEGVICAVLLANAAVPLIEFVSQPRIYGGRRFWKAVVS